MNVKNLLDLAFQVGASPLFAEGVAFVTKVRANAKRLNVVLTDADQAMLDQIHTEALAAADRLDSALANAEKRDA